MNIVFSGKDMFGCIASFLEVETIIVLLDVSKKYRRVVDRYLWINYKISINNLYKKKCLQCCKLDLYSLKYKYCKSCIYNYQCFDCLSISRRPLYEFPASYEFARGGMYTTPYYKYCCLECKYQCFDCGYTSYSDYLHFVKIETEDDQILVCYDCKHKYKDTSPVTYWIGDTDTDQNYPFEDYRYDSNFSDDIFLFSFYINELFL